MSDSLFFHDSFVAALKLWAEGGARDPRIPATQERLIAALYETWVQEPSREGRRSLAKFDEALTAQGLKAASLWRKAKGLIRLKKDELRAFLAVLLVQGDRDASVDTVVVDALVELITRSELDLWRDPGSAWVFSSHADLVRGHQNEQRTHAFRNIMARRLKQLSLKRSNRPSNGGNDMLPFTVWVLDASNICIQDSDGFQCRAAIIGLAECLLAAMVSHLYLPREEFNYHSALTSPPVLDIVFEPDADGGDFRQSFLDTSVVCLTGVPRHIMRWLPNELGAAGERQDVSEADDPASRLGAYLMPEAILNRSNLDLVSDGGLSRPALIDEEVERKTILLGTKVDFESLSALSNMALTRQHDDLTLGLSALHYAMWFDRDSGQEVEEFRLDGIVMPAAVSAAYRMLLVAATAKLNMRDLNQSMVGMRALNRLRRNGVALMAVKEFLNFGNWLDPIVRGLPETKKTTSDQTRR